MHPIPESKTRFVTICFVVLVSLACFARAGAATLADYRHRVSAAIAVIEQLQAAYDDEDPSLREHLVITSVARIREELPAKGTIQLNAQGVIVDKTWLPEPLQAY